MRVYRGTSFMRKRPNPLRFRVGGVQVYLAHKNPPPPPYGNLRALGIFLL